MKNGFIPLSLNTVLHVGATPVLADIGPDRNIDPERVIAAVEDVVRKIAARKTVGARVGR